MIINKNETILLVDDNPENLRLLSKILEGYGFNIRVASRGERALATIRKEAPSLVLLDIMMPEKDGFETCKELKADKKTANIPIIFISALDETIDKVKGFSLGAVDYITKPFQTEEIIARITTHLSLRSLQIELEKNNRELTKALEENKVLRGFISICAYCKKVRTKEGEWEQIEEYISDHSDVKFSHGYCESCAKENFPELDE